MSLSLSQVRTEHIASQWLRHGPSSIFNHSNNVARKKIYCRYQSVNRLLIWKTRVRGVHAPRSLNLARPCFTSRKTLIMRITKCDHVSFRLYSHLSADKIKHAWRSRFIERNPRMAYISALQFEANLIHHEDHILLKIIVLLQIDAIIFALDSCWEKSA